MSGEVKRENSTVNKKSAFVRKSRYYNKKKKVENKEVEKKKEIKKPVHKEVKKAKTVNTDKRKEAKKEFKEDFQFKKSNLKIIPLGGIEEIGKNITLFEYEDDIIIDDCGLEFPTDDMLGIDLVIPDVSYLVKNQDKIRGMVITHGHEDHIGAIPYVMKQINCPIYATKLTCALIRNKLEEHHLLNSVKVVEVDAGDVVNLGKFSVEFIQSCHSIPDSVMLAIKSPAGTVLHTGDFKIDYTPIDGKPMDLGRIAALGNEGLLALMSDSTNAERRGFTLSEKSVGEALDQLFLNCKKRIVVATFASNVHRVQQIIDCAVKYGRKIAISGRSMINVIKAARELGYIKNVKDETFVDIDMIKNYPDEKLVIMTTGSQGETMSALTRMAAGDHKKVTITPNDLVIISANPIPGNEKNVAKVIDELMEIGAEVVYNTLADIHVSGHACQEEQKLLLSLARPKYFIPVHGEYRQLLAHAKTAEMVGIDKRNIFITHNGRILELNENEAKFTTSVQSGKILVDGLGVGDVGNIVLRDRQHLSQDGLIVIVLTMDSSTGEIVSGPDVISRGFVYVRESENLMEEVKNQIRSEVQRFEERHITDWGTIKSSLKDSLRDFVFQKTKRDPMILPIIMEV